jgi:hypothetical protein
VATTINAYAVSLGLDASNYIDASKVTRSETTQLKRDIAAARDPMEKLAIEQDRLTRALESGAISEGVYNRLLDAKRDKLLGVNDAMDKQHGLFDKLSKAGNIITGIRSAFSLVGDAIRTASQYLDEFNEVASRIDDAKDAADKLGLTFNELGSIKFAAARLGGESAAGAIEKAMQQAMKKGFVEPGESAVDAFARIATEISGIADQSERTKVAMETFGKPGAELVGVLQAGGDEIKNLADEWERVNGLTQAQVEAVDTYNDRLDDIRRTTEAIKNLFVVELAQGLTVFAEEILGIDNSMSGWQEVFRGIVDDYVYALGWAMDAWDQFKGVQESIKGLVTGVEDNSDPIKALQSKMGITKDKEEEVKVSNVDRLMSKLASSRLQAETKAWQAEQKLLNERKEATETAAGERLRKILDGEDEIQDKQDETADNLKLNYDQALREAERYYEAERKQQMKMREAAGKSPIGAEQGSSEAVKFLADQANRILAGSGDPAETTDEQLLAKAQEQLAAQQTTVAKQAEMVTKLQELIEETKNNGFKRVR